LCYVCGADAHAVKWKCSATVIAYHAVKDTKQWLASPMRKKCFDPLGAATGIRTNVAPPKPTRGECLGCYTSSLKVGLTSADDTPLRGLQFSRGGSVMTTKRSPALTPAASNRCASDW
jgi:hypothetical protein